MTLEMFLAGVIGFSGGAMFSLWATCYRRPARTRDVDVVPSPAQLRAWKRERR